MDGFIRSYKFMGFGSWILINYGDLSQNEQLPNPAYYTETFV